MSFDFEGFQHNKALIEELVESHVQTHSIKQLIIEIYGDLIFLDLL